MYWLMLVVSCATPASSRENRLSARRSTRISFVAGEEVPAAFGAAGAALLGPATGGERGARVLLPTGGGPAFPGRYRA